MKRMTRSSVWIGFVETEPRNEKKYSHGIL